MSSLSSFRRLVEKKGVAVLSVGYEVWNGIFLSRTQDKLTRVFNREELARIKAPMVCVIEVNSSRVLNGAKQFLCIITGRRAVATDQSSLSFRGLQETFLENVPEIERADAGILPEHQPFVIDCVTGKRALALLEEIEKDEYAKAVARNLQRYIPEGSRRGDILQIERNAISLCKKLFGVAATTEPRFSTFEEEAETALDDFSTLRLFEDNVINHDARWIDGFELVLSEAVGRSVFQKKDRQLEVITANRTPIEKLLGVDLIYVNRELESVVLVQYKMMERLGGKRADWEFRPDDHFRKQLSLLNRVEHPSQTADDDEYRLNSRLSYLKFVKRDAPDAKGSCILPLEHFETLERNGDLVGDLGGVRLRHSVIKDSSLDDAAFIRLVAAGYVGCYRRRANELGDAVEGLLKGGDRLVVAIESKLQKAIPR